MNNFGNTSNNNMSFLNTTQNVQNAQKMRDLEIKIQLDELKGFDPKIVTEMIFKGFNPETREVIVRDTSLVKRIAGLKFGIGNGKDKIIQVHMNKYGLLCHNLGHPVMLNPKT